eukprot:TRINITY_DN7423_c0_g1_i2.p1 TRINITY_DN7423_c0_g1~~TRINITY_DN7423_c0_g1_i2.p1  ORF type:complete len:177 (-),score=49.90 TRINITY_DN7423_c0_g1_i2:163-621(-)
MALAALAAQHKRTLFVAGFDEQVNESVLRGAFIPFGELVDVMIPLDHQSGKHKGFGFVEYELEEDAKEALDNMSESELYGRVLKVNIAKPTQLTKTNKAVWESDHYITENAKLGENAEGAEGEPATEPSSASMIDDKEKARIAEYIENRMKE